MDGGAWWATVHGVTKSQTRLSEFHLLFFLRLYSATHTHTHTPCEHTHTHSPPCAEQAVKLEEPLAGPDLGVCTS